jgi:FKBP-type peptidyl-prolyl cis-trans isomerase FkpA
MKHAAIAFVAMLGLLFSACNKDNGDKTESLEDYLRKENILNQVTSDPRGFYYKIVTPGTGATPVSSSKVSVLYAGKLTNGTVFDQSGPTAVTFTLSQLIPGWQYGLPLIKAGGRILLYLPPQLGYGSQGAGSIPPNSNLIFDITLEAVR